LTAVWRGSTNERTVCCFAVPLSALVLRHQHIDRLPAFCEARLHALADVWRE